VRFDDRLTNSTSSVICNAIIGERYKKVQYIEALTLWSRGTHFVESEQDVIILSPKPQPVSSLAADILRRPLNIGTFFGGKRLNYVGRAFVYSVCYP
jgi:hypothetical protein